MAQSALHDASPPPTLATSYLPTSASTHYTASAARISWRATHTHSPTHHPSWRESHNVFTFAGLGSTGKGILIGLLSAFGSAALVALIIAIVYFFRYTHRGRIFLDRMGRPGEFDDEQQFAREEEEAMAGMDEMQRGEYLRAKAFVQVNPPESMQTDISLSQFLAIQEKGVSAWEFEPELEIANCFVEARTEIEFFDAECSVQSNLPIPKQNEVYYWEAKLYDKPDSTMVNIGLTTKPYPLFRLPGLHKYSIAYSSSGHRRYNQPFTGTSYGPQIVHGDVIGVGYRPRTGTIFFTRNGKKLEDVAHGLKSQNFFPTVGANGPAQVHVNFGQMGFVFIEANVKKWGLAPQTGSLAPPPPYGSEAGSILLEGGREGVREGQGYVPGHGRTNSAQIRLARGPPARSPGPERSPTDISLAQFNLMDAQQEEYEEDEDVEEGPAAGSSHPQLINPGLPLEPADHAPPDYESPDERFDGRRGGGGGGGGGGDDYEDEDESDGSTPRASGYFDRAHHPRTRSKAQTQTQQQRSPPIPSYEAATGDVRAGRGRSATRTGRDMEGDDDGESS